MNFGTHLTFLGFAFFCLQNSKQCCTSPPSLMSCDHLEFSFRKHSDDRPFSIRGEPSNRIYHIVPMDLSCWIQKMNWIRKEKVVCIFLFIQQAIHLYFSFIVSLILVTLFFLLFNCNMLIVHTEDGKRSCHPNPFCLGGPQDHSFSQKSDTFLRNYHPQKNRD